MSKFTYKLSELFQDVNIGLLQCLIIENIVAYKIGVDDKGLSNSVFLAECCIKMGSPIYVPSEIEKEKLSKFLKQFNRDEQGLYESISLAFYGEYKQLLIELRK